MAIQNKYGLIGRNISYSFSKQFFEKKFKKLMLDTRSYEIFDLAEIAQVNDLFSNPNLRGFNVTIPYKVQILEFLDELSDEAKEIGAVNTVKILPNGKKIGYNTDAYGFEKTLNIHLKTHHKNALILGDGGAAKAVKYVLDKKGIAHQSVCRNSKLNFETLDPQTVLNHEIIIQATPVGTFPKVEDCLDFPFSALSEKHLVFDLIYNPNYTQFIKNAANYGATTTNGYYMLEQQAEKAWQIWNID